MTRGTWRTGIATTAVATVSVLAVAGTGDLPAGGRGEAGFPGHAEAVVAPGARVEKLAGGFAFTEGATCDAAGDVYFTDQPTDRILRWSAAGTLSTFRDPAGRWRSDRDTKKVTVLVKGYGGRVLNGPNDVWLRPDGGLYFTDPYYKRDYWRRGPKEQDVEGVYFLAPDRKTLMRVADDLKQPNGITGTPDGRTLYVADIAADRTYAYDIRRDGSLANKRLFCEAGSDGMTIDAEGNLYLTREGVLVFDKVGRRIATIEVPERPANVCFGGKDRRTLFITARTGLYSVRMRTRGVDDHGGK